MTTLPRLKEDPRELYPVLYGQLTSIVGAERVSYSTADRVLYSHDILPTAYNWIKAGILPYVPDFVVWPETAEEISEIVRLANAQRIPVVPFGGGSATLAGISPLKGGITIDMKRMNKIVEIDEVSMTATVQTGMMGRLFEDALNERGLTCGHYPQSIFQSAVGGWIACRGVGTFSSKYGKIEDMVLALQVVLPDGKIIRTPKVPRSSCGPDLDQLFVGSEGTLGIITEATLTVRPLPERREWLNFTFPTVEQGVEAIRKIMQKDIYPACVRLYDPLESKPFLQDFGLPLENQCVLFFGCEGISELVDLETKVVRRVCEAEGGRFTEAQFAQRWWRLRFDTGYIKRAQIVPGGVGDAIEASASYSNLAKMLKTMTDAMYAGGAEEVFGHISHVYINGGSVYIIWKGQAESEKEAEVLYYRVMKNALEACKACGGSIGHHHSIGVNKYRWMWLEYGEEGMDVMTAIKRALDPNGIMNPGKLGF